MKKKYLLLFLFPIILSSCGNSHRVSYAKLKEKIDLIENSGEHPFYRVQGVLDLYDEIIEVHDALFNQTPNGTTFVPYSRYNEGFYNENNLYDIRVKNEEDIVIYGLASRSYWLRMPLYINKDNFYVELDGKENPTCAHYDLMHCILPWYGQEDAAQPSSNKVYYEILPNGDFAIGGNRVHTNFYINNYPCYPDPASNPDLVPEWTPDKPFPMETPNGSPLDVKGSFRFVYDKDGWLKQEKFYTIGYDAKKSSATQIYLESVYTYQFS